MPKIDGERLLGDLRTLRSIGASGTGVVRPAFSAKDMEARRWLEGRYREAGLEASIRPHRVGQEPAFLDRPRHRLLHVDIFVRLAGPDAHQRMPVVGGRDGNGVNVLPLQQLPHIDERLQLAANGFPLLSGGIQTVRVGVA